MADLTEVLAALEGAQEWSPELDVQIHCAVLECSRSHWVEQNAPAYTLDLNDAMTLVPDDHSICYHRACRSDAWHHDVELYAPLGRMSEGAAPTFALALCIAALKARAAQTDGEA